MLNISPLREWLSDPDASVREKTLYIAMALTFFCLPLGTAPQNIAGFGAVAIWLFSGIAVEKRHVFLASYWQPVFAMILIPWVGMLYTPDPMGLGMDYAMKTHYWFFGFTVAAIAFRRFPATGLIFSFMLGLAINVLAAMVQIVFHLHDKNNGHRGMGPDYSTLSAYLIVGIMMGLFFLRRENQPRLKIVFAGATGLYFLHLVILKSRASYVAFLLLVPLMGYTFFTSHKILKTTALCILIPCLMMFSPVVRQRLDLSVDQLVHHLNTDAEVAWGRKYSAQQDRFYMWNGALKIIAAHPWIGVGTGGYQTALKNIDPDPMVPTIAHPHNNFLYMAASFGAVGMGVLVWFLWVTLVNGWRHRDSAQGYLLLSVILVMITTGLFNTQILDAGTLFLITLAVGMQSSFKFSLRREIHGIL